MSDLQKLLGSVPDKFSGNQWEVVSLGLYKCLQVLCFVCVCAKLEKIFRYNIGWQKQIIEEQEKENEDKISAKPVKKASKKVCTYFILYVIIFSTFVLAYVYFTVKVKQSKNCVFRKR